MLGALYARPKPWILTALTYAYGGTHHRYSTNPLSFVSSAFIGGGNRCRRLHSSACRIGSRTPSIWHAILPSGDGEYRNGSCFGGGEYRNGNRSVFHHEQKGEGSWSAGLDVRPARWLHSSESAWLLFGVCGCLAPLDCPVGEYLEKVKDEVSIVGGCTVEIGLEEEKKVKVEKKKKNKCSSLDYRVTGVTADGRCLFRALSYGSCIKRGEETPDDNRQRELADDLRAKVVDELLKRREETEWFIEGDFDEYVKNIQRPNAWGGEPELLMASHVLRMSISVFMIDKSSCDLIHIASYGEDYGKDEIPIKVVFHGYGHYDVLETFSEKV
ncbi:hypothetical protein GIB67_034069 [Kingdonia uniflora]|uniref:Ubiquitin thioesterase OTU n=1 Tax=Kingdonia uniflora TaxID=39325 RepID=A0A7J7M6D9_9MAGN|nr:hypothetical protein GIB67_034069 [Kingdonia uniflora]